MRVLASLLVATSLFAAAADKNADSPGELALALARKARKAEKSGQSAQAYIYYSEASALQPRNRQYKARMDLLQTKAASQSKPVLRPAGTPGDEPEYQPLAPDLAPENVFDSLTEKEMAEARELKETPRLNAKPGTQSFDLNADPRGLFDRVAQSFGLGTVYDGDYPSNGPRIAFRVGSADYREALNDLEAATGSFVIPLSPKVLMVAKDTPAKRTDLEQTMIVAIPVPQILTTQELTEMTQVVRQITNIEKIGWDAAHGRIVIRDHVSRVMPALALLDQLFAYRPEVMLDVEFLQISSSDMLNYGFTVTNSFSGIALGQILNNVVTAPSGVTNLLTFGGGKTLIGIGVAQAEAMFNQTNSTSDSLYRAQLRSVAGQPASLHLGEKYPVITSGYVGTVPASQAGQVYSPPPSFTYENLGLEMKLTPFVHGMDEVTLTVEASFELLTGGSVNNIPVIGRRDLKSQVRLRNEEWAVIGGLMTTTSSKAVSGFWGLAQIPLLGYLFKQTSTDKEESNVLIGIRPHLLSLPPNQIVTRALRVGSDMRPFTPL